MVQIYTIDDNCSFKHSKGLFTESEWQFSPVYIKGSQPLTWQLEPVKGAEM